MAEPRRAQLISLSTGLFSPVSTAAVPVGQLLPPGPPAELSGLDPGTVRLVLALFESTERAFPEFSYPQLLDCEKSSQVPQSRMEQQEQREQDELAQIAKQLEEKYGEKPRHKDRVQDLIDIGHGYDDEDSFIDNSEAYDEFVPASITTKLGGFYVNSGLLRFKRSSDTEPERPPEEPGEEPGEEPPAEGRRRRKVSKKRKLKSGLDKPHRCDDDTESDAKPSLASEPVEETLKRKKKKKLSTLSVTSALRKCEKERERQLVDQLGASARGPPLGFNTLALGPADAGGGGCVSFTEPLFRLIGSRKELALDSDLDCVLVSENSGSCHFLPSASTDACQPVSLPNWKGDGTEQGTRGHIKAEDTESQVCPPALEDSIHKLKQASKSSEGESKVKFYTPEINNLLLQIDVQCRQYGGALRSRVYSHLCSFLPCNKDTLLRRVSRLKHSRNVPVQEEPDVDPLMKTVPEQILSWKENS